MRAALDCRVASAPRNDEVLITKCNHIDATAPASETGAGWFIEYRSDSTKEPILMMDRDGGRKAKRLRTRHEEDDTESDAHPGAIMRNAFVLAALMWLGITLVVRSCS